MSYSEIIINGSPVKLIPLGYCACGCGKLWDEQGVEIKHKFSLLGTKQFPLIQVPRCNPCQQKDITAAILCQGELG